MVRYVCGLMFSDNMDRVLLIRKRRPAWQAGLLNGVGGKVEDGEEPIVAMCREFREETGMSWTDWTPIIDLLGDEHEVLVYSAVGPIESARSTTDEEVGVFAVSGLAVYHRLVRSLEWIIPLALDRCVASPTTCRIMF